MACTFDSPCLTSQVNGVQPSFGFKPHNTGYFGIQASFTHGTHKCYETAAPTWQPVIKSGAYDVTCTWIGAVESIYCPQLPVTDIGIGTHTLSYSAPRGSPAPFYPTTFVVAYPPRSKPDQPAVATNYVTVTLPSSTKTQTYTSTIRKEQTTYEKTGTLSLPGPTVTKTAYTYSSPRPVPTYTTETKHTRSYKTKTQTSYTTAPCNKPEWEHKPEGNPWDNQGKPDGKPEEMNPWKQWGQEVWGDEMREGQQGPPQGEGAQGSPQGEQGPPEGEQGPPEGEGEQQQGYRKQGGQQGPPRDGPPAGWSGSPWGGRNGRAPLMNYDVVETVSAGATARVQVPCKGACGGWSGPDATFAGQKGPKQTMAPRETITWTKTTTKYYGVKTVPTTTAKYQVNYRTKKYPATTTSVYKFKTTTKTLPPKFTPKWTKTTTTTATWPKTTYVSITKTVPCKVKTVTSLETKTFVETVAGGWGNWGGEGEWNNAARATGSRDTVDQAEECAGCERKAADEKPFSWADVVKDRKAELEAEKTLTAGAKFRF